MDINIYSTFIEGEKVIDYISFLSKDTNYFLEVSSNAESICKTEISKLKESIVRMGFDYYNVETFRYSDECLLITKKYNSEDEPIEYDLITGETSLLNISLGMDELVIQKY